MSKDAVEVFNAALRLPTEKRAELAAALLHSLDGAIDPGADRAWTEEIERRIQEVRDGSAELIDWETLRERVWPSAGQ